MLLKMKTIKLEDCLSVAHLYRGDQLHCTVSIKPSGLRFVPSCNYQQMEQNDL